MEQKRLFIFFAAVAVLTLLANVFFYYQNQEKQQAWNQQQLAKRTEKIKKLEQDVATRSIKEADLPIVELFKDAQGETFLTAGILDGRTILTLSWDGEPPQKIYARKAGTQESLQEYVLEFAPTKKVEPILYRQGVPEKLLIGNLPDFGSFTLQLISLFPQNKQHPFTITVADYKDGHFSIPQVQLEKLKKEVHKKPEEISSKISNGLVVMKTASGFLPVALYNASKNAPIYLEEIENLSSNIKVQETKAVAPVAAQVTAERFFVLENDYQQLVFSNVGGSLVEINLPFKSNHDSKSVVREIEYDREMVEKHPYNARFPSQPYSTPGKNPQGPYEDHIEGKLGGYYPLIRRDLIQSQPHKSVKIPPRFYALNIVSEYPEVAQTIYEVKEFTKEKIVFESNQSHRKIRKTFSLVSEAKGAPYCIELTIQIEGDGKGLWLTSGVPEVELISGSPAPVLKYRITRNTKAEVDTVDLPKDALTNTSIYPDWVVNSNGFFGVILNPITQIEPGYRAQYVPGNVVPSRLVEIEEEYQKFKVTDLPGYMMMMPLKSGGAMTFHIFAGPFAGSVLKAVDNYYADPSTGYNPDFIACQTFHGWFAFISEPFAKFLFILMNFFYLLTNSWAISIILLTVALRIMLYPLNAWSMKSMIKMQQIAPEVTALQEKYKKDPKKAQIEIMSLYRERSVNPMSGCLPLLIQMPFLIGMFDLLKSTFELRGASFIPGWIDNLTSPDVLFSWSTPIFFIGNQFHLLPILLGLTMFIQQRMSTTLPKDPSLWTEQQRQQRAMTTIMPIVFTLMFYNFPSGLNIYWLSSTVLGILQQWWTKRQLSKTPSQEVAAVVKK